MKNYKNRVTLMFKRLDTNKPILTVKIIREYLENKTITYHAAIKSFMKFVEGTFNLRFSDIDYPPVRKYEEKAIVALTEKQVEDIINKIPEEFKFFTKFVYICGLRISEPYGITIDDINWDQWKENMDKHGFITIKKTKSNKERVIPIKPSFMNEIREYVVKRDGKMIRNTFLFDFHREDYYNRKKRKLRKKRVLPDLDTYIFDCFVVRKKQDYSEIFKDASKASIGRKHTPHILRKTRATLMLRAGVPLIEVSKFLGHADIKTTMKYLAIDINDLTKSMRRFNL